MSDGADVGGDRTSQRFDRLPAMAAERRVDGRPSREGVVGWWCDRFGVPPATWEGYTFWEKGTGKVWGLRGDAPSPIAVEALGLHLLRTRGADWKPTTNAAQRFGRAATRNVIELPPAAAARFVRGEDQALDRVGDRGYVIAARRIAGDREPIGVGLYVDGVLRSQVPKARRRDLP